MPSEKENWSILVTGVVQSVGFRPFVKRLADRLGLQGYVQNLGDAGVKIYLHHVSSKKVDEFVYLLKKEKPELAVILDVEVEKLDKASSLFSGNDFIIKPSENKVSKSSSGFSAIPPDIAICDECIEDMKRVGRRFEYVFTSCTNCGPRYSAIIRLPYDRPNTSFKDFPLCKECLEEYTSPADRRFHAQTTCCDVCGPHYEMFVNEGNEWVKRNVDWGFVASSLREGKIWAVMDVSGTHFFTDALNKDVVWAFRSVRRKKSRKPFAVMMKDIATVEKYCHVSPEDKRLLLSPRRPIVILPVKDSSLWEPVIPGLESLGVMLPYTGIHHVLFWHNTPEAMIATSANLPGIPMPIEQNGVFQVAEGIADGVLVHNRPIIQRVDDSVVKSFGNHHVIIRRARGYVPQPLFHKEFVGLPNMLAVGAEENNTAALFKNGWFIPSQHLGHVKNIETLFFEKNVISHLQDIFLLSPEVVVKDLHPTFHTSQLALEVSLEEGLRLIEVPHHVAHVASLGLDLNIKSDESVLAWAVDGFGYGVDGNAWGGELILLENDKWARVGSLFPVDYAGGDVNALYPGRMLAHYLKEIGIDVVDFLKDRADELFKHGLGELRYLSGSRKSGGLVTTSLGRLLDSVSALLGACVKRSYRGEPAIVLEGLALKHRGLVDAPVFVSRENGMLFLDNLSLMNEVIEMFEEGRNSSYIAKWVHVAVAKSMASLMISYADKHSVDYFGLTGGVAYNSLITKGIHSVLEAEGYSLSLHNHLPPGDGGISAGQLFFAGRVMQNE